MCQHVLKSHKVGNREPIHHFFRPMSERLTAKYIHETSMKSVWTDVINFRQVVAAR